MICPKCNNEIEEGTHHTIKYDIYGARCFIFRNTEKVKP